MKTRSIVILVGAIHVTSALAEECDAILEQGAHNTYEEIRHQDMRSAYERSFCRESRGSTSSRRSGEVDVGIDIFSFGGSASAANARTVAQQSCDKDKGRLSDEGYLQLLHMTVSKEIVDAWRACQETRVGPLILGQLNGDTLVVDFRFRAAGAITTTKVKGAPTLIGVECDNLPITDGTELHPGGIFAACQRTGSGPITIVVNTEYGGARFFAPAKREPKPEVPPPRVRGPNAAALRLSPDGVRPTPVTPPLVGPQGTNWCVTNEPDPGPILVGQRRGFITCFVEEMEGPCKCPIFDPNARPPDPRPAGFNFVEWYHSRPIIGYYEGEVAVWD